MAQLSEVAAAFKKSMPQHNGQRFGPRTSNRPVAVKGFARGTMGSTGARSIQSRDSMAGLKKELDMMNSPLFKAFLKQQHPDTPVLNYMMGMM